MSDSTASTCYAIGRYRPLNMSCSIPVCPPNNAYTASPNIGVNVATPWLPSHDSDPHSRGFVALDGVRLTYICGYLTLTKPHRWQAYIGAARDGLSRFQIPRIGPIADKWVSEE